MNRLEHEKRVIESRVAKACRGRVEKSALDSVILTIEKLLVRMTSFGSVAMIRSTAEQATILTAADSS